MRFNVKNLLILLVVIALVGVSYFVFFSKRSSVKNYDITGVSAPSGAVRDGEISDSETNKNAIKLEIASPQDGEIVTKSPVLVSGTTVGGADVFVNDAETKADANGEFKVSVTLNEGENEIFVTANDVDGNYAEGSVTITLNTE